jgi:large subunit ribosomal protein L18
MSIKLNKFNRRKDRVRANVKSKNKSNHKRVVVFRSNKNFYAQLIDDDNGNVITSFSSLVAKDKIKKEHKGNDIATLVGEEFAKLCVDKKVKNVVFDKGAYLYGGRVKNFADSCRKNGLKF